MTYAEQFAAWEAECLPLLAKLVAAQGQNRKMLQEAADLEDALLDVSWQACADPVSGEAMDSMALSSYADALRLLARRGRVRIIKDVGRRVIAVPIKAAGAR